MLSLREISLRFHYLGPIQSSIQNRNFNMGSNILISDLNQKMESSSAHVIMYIFIEMTDSPLCGIFQKSDAEGAKGDTPGATPSSVLAAGWFSHSSAECPLPTPSLPSPGTLWTERDVKGLIWSLIWCEQKRHEWVNFKEVERSEV